MARVVLFLMPLMLFAGPVAAGDAERGELTVIDWCGGCHVIGTGQAPPGRPPAFSTILQIMSPASIEHYLSWERHEGMPALALEEDDLADIVAYFERLNAAGD